jgi:hypothetical protein
VDSSPVALWLSFLLVSRWYERGELRGGCYEEEWDKMISLQEEAKKMEEATKKVVQEGLEEEVRRETDSKNRLLFRNLDDSVAASPWKGRSLKVIVKVSNNLVVYIMPFGHS